MGRIVDLFLDFYEAAVGSGVRELGGTNAPL